ncbi:MAG: hypothetical protein ACYDA8_20090 [Deferrisomatales bacterium]
MRFLLRRLERMTKGGIAGLIAVLALAGLVVFFVGARHINTTPSQCASCHPEVTAMWKRSQGHPAGVVTCHECHGQHAEVPAGPNIFAFVRDQLIPEKYFSADERVEGRCRGCHEPILSADTEQKKLIRVNHKLHLTGVDAQGRPVAFEGRPLELKCLECHRTVAHDKAQVETNRPTMAGCFTGDCHRKDRNKDNCRRCHYQHLAEPGQELL